MSLCALHRHRRNFEVMPMRVPSTEEGEKRDRQTRTTAINMGVMWIYRLQVGLSKVSHFRYKSDVGIAIRRDNALYYAK